MLDKFITAVCDGDLSVLVTDWTNVTEKDVKEAWCKIQDEHSDLLKNREKTHLEQVSKELNILITKRNVIYACIYRLSVAYSEEIVNELKKWTLVVEKFNQDDLESYTKDLETIKNRNARIDIDIRHLQEELKKQLPEGIERQNTRSDYIKNVIALEKHKGHAIDESKTSVHKYDLMLADLMMRSEEMDRQKTQYA